MSKLAVGLMAGLIASTSLVGVASAQGPVGSGPGPGPASRPMPCGAPLTGEAPDVMTFDRATGTQVFVGGKGQTEVSAFNRDTGSSAALRGDLSRPGVTESCAVDKLSGDAYRVSSQGPGDMQVTGRTGETGERWSFRAPDGSTQYWDPRGDNNCFRQGLGLGANGGLGSGPRGDGRQGC
ncbi:hypothetical protein ASD21_15235 [Caulobacter sp. Root1455]|uniref:hypothetical protein n=1 Tax=Caulobacter sp. Root1455 TaxID=1736465 RepID=UPI0006FD8A91|nr:hypothetical protein [Caulobacter sp. Root1455]KQY92723.1 hypothetical protein ASD21_15235 [Caulobacter sp. Root1455]